MSSDLWRRQRTPGRIVTVEIYERDGRKRVYRRFGRKFAGTNVGAALTHLNECKFKWVPFRLEKRNGLFIYRRKTQVLFNVLDYPGDELRAGDTLRLYIE